jgi:hypothetical protein
MNAGAQARNPDQVIPFRRDLLSVRVATRASANGRPASRGEQVSA